jgi:APA family basic amino acid/polyamine antiporter
MTSQTDQSEPATVTGATPTGAEAGAVHLRRALRSKDYFTLAFGSMVGVGWMLVIDDWLSRGGSAGAMLGFLIGGLILFPIGYCYGKLTERMPDAGSEVAYTAAVFPRPVSYATGWAMSLAYLIVCPYEAVAIGRIAAYAISSAGSSPMDRFELYRVGGYPVYLPHLLAGLILTAVIVAVNYKGIRISATFQNVTTFGLLAIFAVFATLGVIRGSTANLNPPFADTRGISGGLLSTLLVLQIVPYFMTGFEAAPKCSEEAASDFDHKYFLRMIYLALGAGICFYVIVIGVVSMVQPWQSLTKENFATAVAFQRAFGSRFISRLIMFGVLLSLLKIFNGNFLTSTRLLYAMGRRGLLESRLAHIHPEHRTPSVAVIFVGVLTAGASFLGRAALIPISEVGSLACAIGWTATSLSFWRGAAGPQSRRSRAVGIIGVLVGAALILMKLLPFVPGSFGRYEYLSFAGWAVLGYVLWLRRSGQ